MNLRTLGLLVLSMTALMAFAASAHATTVTSPTGTVATGVSHSEAEGHAILHNPSNKIECASTLEGALESHGEGVTAGGALTTLSFTNCTNNWHVTVSSLGSLASHYVSGYNATLTSSGVTLESTRFGITCRYRTNETDIGTATGGSPGTLDIQAQIPFHGGSGLCGTGATAWTGSYKSAEPLYYDA